MFSLFKSKSAANEPPTLKTRVEKFWKWYGEVASRFYQTIESGKCSDLGNEVSAKIDELLPGFAWVFGPGENKQGHSFTLSGEGVLHRQLIALYWLERAPKLQGWTFYASRQPSNWPSGVIDVGEKRFDPKEFWITPSINLEEEKIDIAVWHPLFNVLEERRRWTILFLFLDEVLGEYGTQQFIGKIEMTEGRLGDAIPLKELLTYAEKAKSDAGWKKYPPGNSGVTYKCAEPHDRFLRGDIFIGSSSNFDLIREYGSAQGELVDPLAGMGADYIFVAFDKSILPAKGEVAARGEIEDALADALKAENSGRTLGGAMGIQRAYIDLMLYDGQKSMDIVRRVLKEKRLPPGTEVHFFAKDKKGHRAVI